MHTAHSMALLANCNRDAKRMRRPFDVADFLPADLKVTVRRSSGMRLTTSNLRLLRPAWEKMAKNMRH